MGLPQWLGGKESACNAGDAGDVSWRRHTEKKSPGGKLGFPNTALKVGFRFS